MKTYTKISVVLFATSLLGWTILIFLVPERLSPSDPPLTPVEHILHWTGGALALPTIPLVALLQSVQPPVPGWIWILAACFISALFWAALLLPLRRMWRRHTEPNAPPNGGPATPFGNSGVAEGPPSVS